MPPVVAGTGLLLVFGRSSALGRTLDAAGLTVPFTALAAVLAGAFVAMPSRKTSGGEFKDIAHPIDQPTRDLVTKMVLDAYREACDDPAAD